MSVCLALTVLLCASALQATCTCKGSRTLSDWSPGSLYGPLGTSAPCCQHCKGNLVKPVPDTNQGILQTATVSACLGPNCNHAAKDHHVQAAQTYVSGFLLTSLAPGLASCRALSRVTAGAGSWRPDCGARDIWPHMVVQPVQGEHPLVQRLHS